MKRLLLVLPLLLGCPSDPPLPVKPAPADAPADDADLAAARDALLGALKQRLTAAIADQGTVHAIDVCQSAAPEIAAEVAQAYTVQIGRTGPRLRNPANQPPEWAQQLVAEQQSEPWTGTGPDGQRRGLYPLNLQPLCLACHGPAEDLSPDLREALAQRYPEDEATGFQVGDLRGWVWVEKP